MQKRLFLLAIALSLLIPATGVLTGLGSMSEQEMAAFEGRRKTRFRQDFPKWFTDNLGLRKDFLKAHAAVLLHVFGQPANPEQAQVGREGFLFLGDARARTFSAHTGAFRLPREELLHLGEGFRGIIALFENRGIPVLVAIAPDKATIYGEYYPSWVKRAGSTLPRDRFTAPPLGEHVLFLEDTLLAAKKRNDLLYWKTDTHWNKLGAYLGYVAVMDRLGELTGQKLERLPLLGWKSGGPRSGDLARMNRVAPGVDRAFDLVFPENGPDAGPGNPGGGVSVQKAGNLTLSANPRPLNPLRVALVVDSFYDPMAEAYRKSFASTREIHISTLDKAALRAVLEATPAPDLVVFLLVERNIPLHDRRLRGIARTIDPEDGATRPAP